MLSKIWLINFILSLFIVFFTIKTHDVFTDKGFKIFKTSTDEKSDSSKVSGKAIIRDNPSESNFDLIANKNIFSPERKEYIPKEVESNAEVKQIHILGETIVLYGVILMDGFESALISNPSRKVGERNTIWIKVGDNVGDLKVRKILTNGIHLEDGNSKKYEVILYDKNKPKKETQVKIEEKPNIISAATGKEQSKPALTDKKELNEGEYEIINTPFGQIKKRKK